MSFELTSFTSAFMQKQAVNEVIKCNEFTANYNLILSHAQAVELVETRAVSLSANGRIEFGGGVIDKLITAFCDSPYISMHNYAETIHELIQMFYYYKNETLDLISDDELITYMKNAFDGVCQGSLSLLAGRELDTMANSLRYGYGYTDPNAYYRKAFLRNDFNDDEEVNDCEED